MKRNNFIKSMLGLPLVIGSLSFKEKKQTNQLIQVKEFTKDTVTQEIAAEFMSIIAWNHLNEKRFANTFTIKQHLTDIEIIDGKRRGSMIRTSDEPQYKRGGEVITENNGISIYSPTTLQRLRIFSDGDWKCTYDTTNSKYSKYEYFSRNIETGKECKETIRDSGHGLNQINMINEYIKHGFLKLSI